MAKMTHQQIIQQWLERDLTEAAQSGELPPAYEVDHVVDGVSELISAARHPIVTGDGGVGKTAVVYELIRRVAAGGGPMPLRGKRVLQFSIQTRMAGLRVNQPINAQFQMLIDALVAEGEGIAPFIRDAHLAWDVGCGPLLNLMAMRFAGPIILEADARRLQAMLEDDGELHAAFSTQRVDEPTIETMMRLLDRWAADQQQRHGRSFTRDALTEALYLSHRFLSRARLPRKTIDLLQQVGATAQRGSSVTGAHTIEKFCSTHRVPRSLVDPKIALDLNELEGRFRSRVLGQREAVRAMIEMIGLIKAGLSDVRRPFGVFLFAGPTGVGKTHLAQLLAEYLFGSRDRVIRLNMADYPEEHHAATLFGSPELYRPADVRGALTMRITGHPFAVLLLDEFEKANPKVHDRFMQLFDEGSFINGAGELVSCRSMIIIATSNVGADVYRGTTFGFTAASDREAIRRELDRRLEAHFRFEFLNRFDRIVHFQPLTRQDIRLIAQRELEQLDRRVGVQQRSLKVEVEESVLDWLAAHGYDAEYGARFLRRTIERNVTTALADAIVRDRPRKGAAIELSVRGSRIVARLAAPEPAKPPKEQVTLPVGTVRESRTLDAETLIAEARSLLEASRPRFETLAERRRRYSELLERMNDDKFWDNREWKTVLLDEFRELDVAIQVEGRLAAPIERLREAIESESQRDGEAIDVKKLAPLVEEASAALADWRTRVAQQGADAVWLIISSGDPLRPAGSWLEDLANMELAWCRHLQLAASVVAYEAVDGQLNRVAIEVEGPGAEAFLAMEVGLHRLYRRDEKRGGDQRARIDLIPRSATPIQPWPTGPAKGKKTSWFGLDSVCGGAVELEQRGVTVELTAARAQTLSHLLHDLSQAWQLAPTEAPAVARTYNEDGSGARDPRTGAILPKLRDAMRGALDRFLEAWRRQADAPEDANSSS